MKIIGSMLAIMAIVAGAQAQGPSIDPEAETVLRALSEQRQKIDSVVFRVSDTIDEVQADGSKLQFAHIRKFTVVRPDKLKVETMGDVMSRILWKDGKTITVLDRTENVYAQITDPGTIEQAVDTLQEKYGLGLPGADLLTGNLYDSMTKDCEAIEYVGIGYVGGEQCHHLAFYRENISWQMWVSMGEAPELRKMVITYKQLRSSPQYTMELLSVDYAGTIDDTVFTAVIPADAEKIEIQPAIEVGATDKEGRD